MALSYGQKDYGNPYAKYSKPKQSIAPKQSKPVTSGFGSKDYGNPYAKYQAPKEEPKTSSKSNSSSSKSSSSKKSSSSNKSSSPVSTNQRSLADLARSAVGINTANASGGIYTPKVSTPTGLLGSVFQKAVEPVKGAYTSLSQGMGLPDFGVSELLGLTKQERGGLTYNTNDTPQTDPATGATIQPSSPSSPFFAQPTSQDVLNLGRGPINYPNPVSTSNTNQSNNQSRDSRPPQQVSNPYPVTPPGTTDLGAIIKQLIEYRPDNTPTQNTNGTVQRPVGMGQFSSGQYGNGAGGYSFGGGGSSMGGGSALGIDASLTGTDENLLNNPFNIPQAQPAPMQDTTTYPGLSFSSGNPQEASGVLNQIQQQKIDDLTFEERDAYYEQQYKDVVRQEQELKNSLDPEELAYLENYMQTDQNGGLSGGATSGLSAANSGVTPGETQQYAQGSPEALLQGQMKGYGKQEKAQKKALDELIKSIKNQYKKQGADLNSQYDLQQTQGTTALDASKQQDLLKLSGLFNFGANQDPNSEQRIQYEGRTNNDYAGQLKDFLAKLVQSRTTDMGNLNSQQNQAISGAKQGYQQQLASIANQRTSTQMELAKMIQSMQGKSSKAVPKSYSKTTGKVSHNDIFNFVNDSLANGASWDEIANGAKAQKVDTSTGSYLDQLLNNANKQGRWA